MSRRVSPELVLSAWLGWALALGTAAASSATTPPPNNPLPQAEDSAHYPYPAGLYAWSRDNPAAIRGATVGPIENRLHPNRGYGTEPFRKTVLELERAGVNWISLTPFGRVWDLDPTGVSLRFEAPYEENRKAVRRAVAEAHRLGQRVLLVPHLWVETGGWRGEIAPSSERRSVTWERGYADFARAWAEVAEASGVDMLAIGVELRGWATTQRATTLSALIDELRGIYSGPLTYAANWDDVHDTVIWSKLDLIGLNAFFPLAERPNASYPELASACQRVKSELFELSRRWDKPILFTEFGYTSRKDATLRPWEWPERIEGVTVDQRDQAMAYRALLSAVMTEPWFAGAFVWRFYSDLDDVTQEPEWGFSPRGKLAELELRDAYASHWGGDGPRQLGSSLVRFASEFPGSGTGTRRASGDPR
jgi:hypothetical protein